MTPEDWALLRSAAPGIGLMVLAFLWVGFQQLRHLKKPDPPEPVTEAPAEETVALRGAQEVARRALCLGAFLCRLSESQSEGVPGWLKGAGLWSSLSPNELQLLGQSEWSDFDQAQVSWQLEGLVALLWALGLEQDMPPYDVLATDPQRGPEGREYLPVFQPCEDFLGQARLRPVPELKQAADVAEMWLWRARTVDEPEIVASVARKLEQQGVFQAVEDDFPVEGVAYARVPEEIRGPLTGLAQERVRALRWLLSTAEDWDEVSLDT